MRQQKQTEEAGSISGKKLRKGTYYKFLIVALDKNRKVISASSMIHVATKGGKVGNYKSMTVSKSVITKARNLRKGRTLKLNARAIAQSRRLPVKRHAGLKFGTTNKNIAVVNKYGTITAKKKGSCYVYVYAQSGVYKTVKVVVR